MLLEDTDYGDTRPMPRPSLLANPLSFAQTDDSQSDGSSSSTPSAAANQSPSSHPFGFRPPSDEDTRGKVPPRPKTLNFDDFIVLKASSECK